MGPRIYTVREANALIPKVEDVLVSLDQVRSRLKQCKNKLDVLEMLWGEEIHSEQNPDHREFAHYVSEIEKAKKDYEACTRRLADMEVMLKSVETGLIDFYGVIDGRLVFLCWKRGEKSIEYYHHLEDGFAGRQAIPAEELAK
jgi:hypothetical protein